MIVIVIVIVIVIGLVLREPLVGLNTPEPYNFQGLPTGNVMFGNISFTFTITITTMGLHHPPSMGKGPGGRLLGDRVGPC